MVNILKKVTSPDILSSHSSKYKKLTGEIIVIKYGGAALEHPELKELTIKDIAFLHQIGICVVIVHGGSRQLDKRMEEIGLQVKSIDGLRYTCDKTIAEAKKTFGEINTEIVQLLQDKGAAAIGVLNWENNLIEAELKGFEIYGYVGVVKSVNIKKIRSIIGQGTIPIIPALGKANDGQSLNINADDVACAVASSLNANRLIFITDVQGILQDPRDPSSILLTTDNEEIESLMKEDSISKGMTIKVQASLDAIRNGIPVVHILSVRQSGALLTEITGETHHGTKIVRKEIPYSIKQVR